MTTTISNIGMGMGMDLKQLEQHPNGLVFKFKKINGEFFHTYCKGKLLQKAGLTPSLVKDHTLYNVMPYEEAKQKVQLYERAWNGEIIHYEGCLHNVHYFAILLPIIKDGKTVEVWATAFDVTWNKIHEKKAENTKRLAMIGQLAAGVAHEIRNPLTSLKGFTQILKEMTTEYDKHDYLTIMEDELERIQQIINEFMLLSRPHESLNIEGINLTKLINNVRDILQPEISLYGLKIIPILSDDVIAQGDKSQIKQVLLNLLQNAIDASSVRKNHIIISLRSLNTYYYEIKVRDFGHGISEERQQRLFEPFYTTKEKGTGLGLMVCKRIVDLHQGIIKIASKENFGTEVIIELPKQLNMDDKLIKNTN